MSVSATRLRIVGDREQYLQHLRPIGLGARAAGWILTDQGPDITLVASTRDLFANPGAVYMDHGVGLQWHGDRTIENIALNASRVLAPNEFLRQRYVANGIATEIIGTPKLDEMLKVPYRPDGPIAISFHWMSASRSQILIRYRDALEDLAGHVWLIGHGHPRAWFLLEPFWRSIGVEPVQSFDEVLERASIYVCDHSSTLYEWAALDRRVVLLDHPGQQALIRISSGLRYQHFADIGPHATPDTLWEAIAEPDRAMAARREATAALFPYLGAAVPRTLEVLRGR